MDPNEIALVAAAHRWARCAGAATWVEERDLADTLEAWIAGVLETDVRWLPRGRWFDGLLFEDCRMETDERLLATGSIHLISSSHGRLPFRAALLLSTSSLRAFELTVGGEERDHLSRAIHRLADPPSANPWAFRFSKRTDG